MAPRPTAFLVITAKRLSSSAAPARNKRPALRIKPVFSAAFPTMKPGQSTRDTTGRSNAFINRKNLDILSHALESIAPPFDEGFEATMPTLIPSIRAKVVTTAPPKLGRSSSVES
eukprot:CAMPEP_0182516680 /NCGR_PEP_ID=MMETSP1321-20130603/40812_1 /TAXON_ID=91990 /ORGANISM="Bolidomonas sp., Strain RCC1657" /LENGTH=114 /DNA_ID=CAMNT_0024724301 /DNA_START=234 /DNA_END=578 /DNA_ORIENTATION=+